MSTAEYQKTTYDRIGLVVKKGKREEYQLAAQDFGVSLSELLKIAVETYIADRSLHDLPVKPVKLRSAISEPTEPKLTKEQSEILDVVEQLPTDAQKALLRFIRAMLADKTA